MTKLVPGWVKWVVAGLICGAVPAMAQLPPEGLAGKQASVSAPTGELVGGRQADSLTADQLDFKLSPKPYLAFSSASAFGFGHGECNRDDVSAPNAGRLPNPAGPRRRSINPHLQARTAPAASAPSSDAWQFKLTPYLFLASQKGVVGTGGQQVAVDARFGDIIDEVNFGFMGAFEARKGRFVAFIDFEYMNVSDSKATPGPLFTDAQVRLKTYIFDPEFGYRLIENKKGSLDALGGIRYVHLGTKLDLHPDLLPAVTLEDGRGWADPVIGLKGRIHLSPRWFLEGKGDLGGFGVGSHFTWQLFGGVGVDLGKRSFLTIGYRHMDVDYSKDGFLYDMATRGPVIGFGLKF